MSEAAEKFRRAAVDNVLSPAGTASPEQRKAAFDNADSSPARALIAKVAANAWKVTDEDVAAAKAAGVSEDHIFELCVTAAMGQATRQLDAARAAIAKVKP